MRGTSSSTSFPTRITSAGSFMPSALRRTVRMRATSSFGLNGLVM